MPGTIKVTVFEAVDLPSDTTDGELVSIKVFVGKTEFQTEPSQVTGGVTTPWNIDFAFPVLNLRDHLEVILLGSNGDQISRSEIETPSIVERGLRDEFFPLKGGGRIHLRLNFVLTDEERKRIELMRAASLKRKQQGTSNNSEFQALQPVVDNGKNSSLPPMASIEGRRQEERIIESKEDHVAGAISMASENPSDAAPDEEKPAVKEEVSQSVMNTVEEQRKESLGLEWPLSDLSVPEQEATASGQPSISAPLVQSMTQDAAWSALENPNDGSNLAEANRQLEDVVDNLKNEGKQKEHKGQNPQNSVNMVKQLFGGAVVIVAGALFMWSRIGNDNKRSPTMSKSISHAERRIESRST